MRVQLPNASISCLNAILPIPCLPVFQSIDGSDAKFAKGVENELRFC